MRYGEVWRGKACLGNASQGINQITRLLGDKSTSSLSSRCQYGPGARGRIRRKKMLDMKDIVPVICDKCGTFGPVEREQTTWRVEGRDELFCTYECANQFVINHNVDEAERKGER